MSETRNSIAPIAWLFPYTGGLALQVAYPKAEGAYWAYPGMKGGMRVSDSLRSTIKDAGLTFKDIKEIAPAIAPGSPYYAKNGTPFARWGNNATVDAASRVRSEYGMRARDIGMDLTSIKGYPRHIVEGHRTDLGYSTYSLSDGRTIHIDEVKASEKLAGAKLANQVQRQANAIATINARSSGMRSIGAGAKMAGKILGPVGAAFDLVSTGTQIASDVANNRGISAGREAAQLGGRWGGMAAGGGLGAYGYVAGPLAGTVSTLGGGILGSFLGEAGVTRLYNSIFGTSTLSNEGSAANSGSTPTGTARQPFPFMNVAERAQRLNAGRYLGKHPPSPDNGSTDLARFESPRSAAYGLVPYLSEMRTAQRHFATVPPSDLRVLSFTADSDRSTDSASPPSTNAAPTQPVPASSPPAQEFRYLARVDAGNPRASVFDLGASALPFVRLDDFDEHKGRGGLPGLLAATLMGVPAR